MNKPGLLILLFTCSVSQSFASLADVEAAFQTAVSEFNLEYPNDGNSVIGGNVTAGSGGVNVSFNVKDSENINFGCHRHSIDAPMECHEL